MNNQLMNHIQTVLNEEYAQKQEYKKARKKMRLAASVFSLSFFAIFMTVRIIFNHLPDDIPMWVEILGIIFCVFGGFGGLVAIFVRFGKNDKHTDFANDLNTDFNNRIIIPVLKEYFNGDVMITRKSDFNPNTFVTNAHLFTVGNIFTADDFGFVNYKGRKIQFFDCNSVYESDSGENRTVHNIFRGQVYAIPLSKSVSHPVRIVNKERREMVQKAGHIYTYGINSNISKYSVQSDSPAFDKEFNCFCKNREDMYYVLTPNMMEALIALKYQLRCDLMITVIGNIAYIAINTGRNAFEIDYERELDARNIYIKICNEAYPLRLVADCLK